MSEHIFDRDNVEYQRDIRPVEQYVDQAAFYISKVKNVPINEAKEKIKQMMSNISNPDNPFKSKTNRVIKFTERQENGDRVIKKDSLTNYIDDFVKNENICAPTFTIYTPYKRKKSLMVGIVDNNKKARAKYKKLKFQFKGIDDIKSSYYDKTQDNKKRMNNANSGGMSSPSTPLFNKTGHSTLTSGCRNTTSLANANNEKILAGNRHYYNVDIILNNITYIASHIDINAIKSAMDKYALYQPSVDDAMKIIIRSSSLYLIREDMMSSVKEILQGLSKEELAGFVYSNDFYHLCMYNEGFFKSFLSEIIKEEFEDKDFEVKELFAVREEYLMMALQVCYSRIKGHNKDYDKMKELGILKYIVPTLNNIYGMITQYKDLFQTFFNTKIVPHSVAYFPQSVRRSVLTSDTDSTIFTSQELIFWYLGDEIFDTKDGRSLQAFLTMLSSLTTEHLLCQMSANFGVDQSKLREIYMKNEFTFDTYVTTQVAKHYYAGNSVQEGNAYAELQREVKGVQLKSSNLPIFIKDEANNLMNEIMDKSLKNEKISMYDYLSRVYKIEQSLIDSIKRGDMNFFKVYTVKNKESYKEGRFSDYEYSTFWNEVFGNHYQRIETVPYQAIKISTILTSRAKMAAWLETLPIDMKDAMSQWLERTGRKDLYMMKLPSEVIRSYGMPKEIVPIVDYKSMVGEICKIFYIILESIGFFLKGGYILSDYFSLENNNGS